MNKVVVLGSAALKIGEAGEFDYSGSQAIKALKGEGVYTILINPNIATIQTSDNLADKVYLLPVNAHFVSEVIKKEKPDGILLSFGGQTALNCGVELYKSGFLKEHGVSVLGTPVDTIINTEDRRLFADILRKIGVKIPKSGSASSAKDARATASKIGYPVMIRIAYALGGLGSGFCKDEKELEEHLQRAFSYADQVLIEEYLEGWKEVEYEVVRDRADNCITVCNMENMDPLGIHTGESIVVAPSQTLSNDEYHKLREVSINIVRHLGVVGECNVQYALDPNSCEYRVIEVNARLSRSSALASKATGYPLAFVAAKLALGKTLPELTNAVTGVTTACFEPALDYIVVKVPRWDFEKFKMVSKNIGSSMKSVGEVMAIGRKFEEALQKAIRMLAIGSHGIVGDDNLTVDNIIEQLKTPTDERIFAITEAFKKDMDIEKIHELTHINKWFLNKILNIVEMERRLKALNGKTITGEVMLTAKRFGFSDTQISMALGDISKSEVREMRKRQDVLPVVKQIDTLGAEYPAQTNYLYMTYNGDENDIAFDKANSVMVLGSGAYKIGSSVEFDWCCVNAVRTLTSLGYKTIVINYNPETVSTDYDECDRLYFDEISFETVVDIYEKEKPIGIIIAMGGQIANNLALKLRNAGVKIIGTSPDMIDMAEDRHKFSSLLDSLKIDQPQWSELKGIGEAKEFSGKIGYPVLVRPSYVLSGAAMSVAMDDDELERFLNRAAEISSEYPVVISKFLMNAKELEVDGVAKDGRIIASVISEHVENAGVHSGDATMVVPPQRTYLETARKMGKISDAIAGALHITGPFNIQFLAKDNEVKVIECNLRASRSFPFVSKVTGTNLVDLATRVMLGFGYENNLPHIWEMDYVGVKAPQFSFTRLKGADPTLSVEMSSTGEVGCLGRDFEEAFLKAMISVGLKLPIKSVLLSTGPEASKVGFIESSRILSKMGVAIYATPGTARFLSGRGVESRVLNWPLIKRQPNVINYIKEKKLDLVINIPKDYQKEELTNDYYIRRAAVDHAIPLITNLQLAKRLVEALQVKNLEALAIWT